MNFREFLENYHILGYSQEGYFDDDEDIDMSDVANQAHSIASTSGINILRNKELSSVARDDAGKVVGALYTSLDGDEFSFDVVTHREFQGQGIGTKLVSDALRTYSSLKFDMPKLKIKADVVSPVMEHILSKMGWRVKQRIGGHTIMVPKRKI